MNKLPNIENLLTKFKAGNLSPQEANELAMLAKEGDKNEELKALLDNLWQNTSDTEVNVPTERMLERLKVTLKRKNVTQDSAVGKSKRISLNVFLRYAAVIIMTIGITWFSKEYFEKSDGTQTIYNNLVNNEITVSYGSKSKVTLPDGSTVNLNSGSTLRYPAHFSKESRNVYIDGEAFFDVKKDPKHPFYVKTHSITIKVLGTKFNVKSYSEEKTVQTTLVTGSIEIYSNQKALKEKNRLVVLKPNQQATCEIGEDDVVSSHPNKTEGNDAEPVRSITVNPTVDVVPVISWKDNRLAFRDERFSELSLKLERWYNVEIDINDENLKQALFSGIFVKESIEQALNALKMATPFHYQMEKNHIIITK